MNNDAARELIKAIVGEIDYDIAKDLDPETAEEPEEAVKLMNRLIAIVHYHLPEKAEPRVVEKSGVRK